MDLTIFFSTRGPFVRYAVSDAPYEMIRSQIPSLSASPDVRSRLLYMFEVRTGSAAIAVFITLAEDSGRT